jgi:hypothetical protein
MLSYSFTHICSYLLLVFLAAFAIFLIEVMALPYLIGHLKLPCPIKELEYAGSRL